MANRITRFLQNITGAAPQDVRNEAPSNAHSAPAKVPASAAQALFENSLYGRMLSMVAEISMERLRDIFLSSESGYPVEMYDLYTNIEAADPRILGMVGSRMKAGNRAKWTVTAGDKTNARSNDAAALVSLNIERLGMHNIRQKLMEGRKNGVAIVELIWERNADGRLCVKQLAQVDFSRIEFDMSVSPNSDTWGRIRLRTGFGTDYLYLRDAEPFKFIPALDKDRRGYHDLSGFMRPVARWFVLKTFAIQSWAQYAETYGFPLVYAKMPEAYFKANKALVKALLENVGPNRYGVFFNEMDIQSQNAASTTNVDVFARLKAEADTEMAIAILGQNLTTEISGGSFAASETHLDVLYNIVEDDLVWQDELMNQYLVDAITRLNFPDLPYDLYPRVTSYIERKRNLTEITNGLRGVAGLVPVPVSHIYEVTGVPQPAEDEPVIGGYRTSLLDTITDTI